MNQLSWLLYLADVFNNIGWMLGILAFATIVGGVIWCVAALVLVDSSTKPKEWRTWRRIGVFILLPCFLFGVILDSFVPSKETMYAIVASERGEQLSHTATFNKAQQALNACLDKQITPSK